MAATTTERRLLGGRDVRAERARWNLDQTMLAKRLGWYPQVIMAIESDDPHRQIELTQAEYQRVIDTAIAIGTGTQAQWEIERDAAAGAN